MIDPQRFHENQEITPNIKKFNVEFNYTGSLPVYGEIYHVQEYTHTCRCGCGKWFIILKEIPDMEFKENCFDPVMPTSALVEELNEIFEPIEA